MIRELLSWLGLMTSKIEGRKMLHDIGVFDSLSKLVDSNGYYDHLNQIILNSFTFESNNYGKNLLRKWSTSSSVLFSKSILEYIRAHKRTGLQDFFEWCFDILMNLAGYPDR